MGRLPPAPFAPRSAPQCALVQRLQPGPGIWRRDGVGWGETVVRYLKQSRGNKAGLCAPKQPERGAGRQREGCSAHARGPGRARVTQSFPPGSAGPALTPCRPLPGGQADGDTTFHLLAVTCLIEKRSSHFPCFYRKHRSLK